MSRPPNYYAPLKETEQQVNDALNQPQNLEPERPDWKVHPGARHGWAEGPGLVEQQASALEWVKAADQQRRELAAGAEQKPEALVERSTEVTDEKARQKAADANVEMTDTKQAQYDRWTGQPLDASQSQEQSRDGGQSRSR
jgi:hypothetical protein